MSPGDQPTAIDVAVVNWNTAEAALRAAGGYLASSGVEARVTIADNASLPEQRKLLRERTPPGVRLEENEENLGYGRAANQVLARGEAEMVCVSNADVLPRPDMLAALARVALSRSEVGMVGPAFDGGTGDYHAKLPGAAALLGQTVAGSFGRRAVAPPPAGEVQEVEQPSGACFLLNREAWEETGGFDEGFFLWFEDVDLAKRLHDAGRHNLVAGSARASHIGARAFAQLDPRLQQAIRLDSVERYIGKHHAGLAPVARPLLAVSRKLRGDG
jgi:N-acetylglucosaminyl-diphospho-decaprenol L-rhamnosyltransferase